MNQQQAIEFVTFQLQPSTERESFLQAAHRSQQAVQHYAGYESRTLLHVEESGEWLDLVGWSSLEAAQQAAAAFGNDPAASDLIAALDGPTVNMNHYMRLTELEALGLGTSSQGEGRVEGACVEVVRFKLKDGANRADYEQVIVDMTAELQTSPGFIAREVGYNDTTGEWLEVIHYTSREAANALFEKLQHSSCMARGMALIDEATLTMQFAAPVSLEQAGQLS
ncbi:hypothetical protein [Paenibacillus sp. YYML68]|uniref:hypothetical protein n=1 Tax=Paenibacillus sp. YYML68 TaxID=2909250 RepID=UPI00248F7AA5|nr:hypothetical protein [Paenibacillus sp. YYML68]